jgi:Fic family protein
MILFDLVGRSEHHPIYRKLSASSLERQYDFLDSIIVAALESHWFEVSQGLICALNHHAIACLHDNAGEYRPIEVEVGNHIPPRPEKVKGLMDDMIEVLNTYWDTSSAIMLAALALWRLNWIHPFVNGNGRTARALCYYIICMKNKGFPENKKGSLPQLIRDHRDDYVNALQESDRRFSERQGNILRPVASFLRKISEY